MLIPLTHDEMTVQRLPWVTILLITANFLVFFLTWPIAAHEQRALIDALGEVEQLEFANPGIASRDFPDRGARSLYQDAMQRVEELRQSRLFARFGFVPSAPSWSGLIGSMFLHAGWMHLLGNMYLLWLCGCTVEDNWGRPLFAALYFAGGLVASNVQAAAFPDSAVPMVGASGAISGLMGIFLIRYFRARIRFFYVLVVIFGTFHAPAWLMLPLWIGNQLLSAVVLSASSGVAFWAHVGGFFFGVAAALAVKWSYVEEAFLAPAIHRHTNLLATDHDHSEALRAMEDGRHRQAIEMLQEVLKSRRDDVDAMRLLAQAYHLADLPAEAMTRYKDEMLIRLRRREMADAVTTYFDLIDNFPDVTFDDRTLSAVAGALMRTDYTELAGDLYGQLWESSRDMTTRLRAAIALVDRYRSEERFGAAADMLQQARLLASGSVEWQQILDDKLAALSTVSGG